MKRSILKFCLKKEAPLLNKKLKSLKHARNSIRKSLPSCGSRMLCATDSAKITRQLRSGWCRRPRLVRQRSQEHALLFLQLRISLKQAKRIEPRLYFLPNSKGFGQQKRAQLFSRVWPVFTNVRASLRFKQSC